MRARPARHPPQDSPGQPLKDARQALLDAGVLAPDADPDLYRFTKDASFGSPSGASAAIARRSDNGKLTWCVEGDGKSYGAWRARLIGNSAA